MFLGSGFRVFPQARNFVIFFSVIFSMSVSSIHIFISGASAIGARPVLHRSFPFFFLSFIVDRFLERVNSTMDEPPKAVTW